ncbi:auxin efflux carrier [Jimgerdemannia flammicorona]|nr:auxin efflux carrier [Jimgerdemannia flammicorona]
MAVIMSLSQSPPFVASDSAKGVAYVSIFAVVAFASLFPLGGYKLIENDFKRKHVEDPEQNVTDTKSLKIPTINIVNEEKHGMHPLSLAEVGVPKISDEKSTQRRGSVASTISIRTISFSNQPNSHVPASDSTTVAVPATSAVDGDYLHSDDFTNKLRRMSAVKPIQWNSALNEPVEDDVPTAAERDGLDLVLVPTGTSMRAVSIKEVETFSGRLRIWLLSIFIPPNIAMILGMTIALVPQLKALFVIVSDGPSILAPDGQPPLAFVYDTMNFIGAAAVPAGIMLLGAALANLQLSAVKPVPCFSLAFIKLVVNPLICILCVRALVFHGIIDPADKMLQFVIMFQSAIPTATTCVYLTQMYSPTGEAKEIAGYLVVQYALGIFTMTASICIILSFLY